MAAGVVFARMSEGLTVLPDLRQLDYRPRTEMVRDQPERRLLELWLAETLGKRGLTDGYICGEWDLEQSSRAVVYYRAAVEF